MRQNGSSLIVILLAIALTGVLITGAYYLNIFSISQKNQFIPQSTVKTNNNRYNEPSGYNPVRSNQTNCSKLEPQLYQLTQANDPDKFASNASLDYQMGNVRIEIVLEDSKELTSNYDLTVKARYANLVEGVIPLSYLCKLASDPNVRSVRATRPPQLN